MANDYKAFFERISKEYGMAGGYSRLYDLIDTGKLRDGLDEQRYGVAKNVIYNFFNEHNSAAAKRTFGITPYDIKELTKKAEEQERMLRILH